MLPPPRSSLDSKSKLTMTTIGGNLGIGGDEVVEVGFAKLQGEDFEYYMQTYSIMLGRNSKKSSVDVDLASLGGGMNISRHHARIYYDFPRKRFALEVIGKNGCTVENVLYLPGSAPIKLDSQDLLQIGDKRFYFLLPTRSVFDTFATARQIAPPLLPPSMVVPPPSFGQVRRLPRFHETSNEDSDREEREGNMEDSLGLGHGGGAVRGMMVKKKLKAREAEASYGVPRGGMEKISLFDKKVEPRARNDRETDNQQLMQLEEKDVVSSVANVLSDLCGPGEWMPMATLHSELMEQYGNTWHHSRVRRYLTSDDWPPHETKGKPWFGLLTLLRKYPEHFVINTRSKGRVTSEFVSLVSLLS